MSWAVGWDRELNRHRGYGVPAYCDAKGCRVEIDRGLGFVAERYDIPDDEEWDDLDDGAYFTCGDHEWGDIDDCDLPPEHPDWIKHLLTDSSWAKWREENPERVAALTPP